MSFYARFHVLNTYDNRINTAITTMHNLYQLITLAETDTEKENLYKAYETVADQFTEMTKDIPEKNGIKVINKETKYYANGLVKSQPYTIIAKPFAYGEIKSTTIKPTYTIFPKTTGYSWRQNNITTTSVLVKAYLKYKLTGKLTSGKITKIPDLYKKVNTLLSEFTFDENNNPLIISK